MMMQPLGPATIVLLAIVNESPPLGRPISSEMLPAS
jgi:hypothetical protein